VKYFVGYDKGERLNMSKEICIQAKIVEAAHLFSPTAPLPLLMTGHLQLFAFKHKTAKCIHYSCDVHSAKPSAIFGATVMF
jgi:hypothetical protein